MASSNPRQELSAQWRAEALLDFWFGNPQDPTSDYGQQRKIWFKKDSDFDTTVRQHFLDDYEQAKGGQLESWLQAPRPCLAFILLLDQVPRNIFRGSPQSFATDSQALRAARFGLNQGWDQELIPVERIFFYLPFEHSEELADQDLSLSLFRSLVKDEPDLETTLDFAKRHREVIYQFGRFPHRNEILNRSTTAEEKEFLRKPGSRF